MGAKQRSTKLKWRGAKKSPLSGGGGRTVGTIQTLMKQGITWPYICRGGERSTTNRTKRIDRRKAKEGIQGEVGVGQGLQYALALVLALDSTQAVRIAWRLPGMRYPISSHLTAHMGQFGDY